MESFFGEKEYNYNYSRELSSGSNKIDLTLKLSPCGENPEEVRKLKRSSSLLGSGARQWGPFVGSSLERSSSLPSEADEKALVRFGALQRMRRAETGKRMMLQRQRSVVADSLEDVNHSGGSTHVEDGSYNNIPYIARQHSTVGFLDCNIQKASSTKQENHDSVVNSNKTTIPPRPSSSGANSEIRSERFKLGNYCSLKGDVLEILRQMPSVRTTGDGPNGKRIEGFLYKYMNGEVCIVCVCHGNFLTPEEFILHAGGKQVENPMKHITVYTNNSF